MVTINVCPNTNKMALYATRYNIWGSHNYITVRDRQQARKDCKACERHLGHGRMQRQQQLEVDQTIHTLALCHLCTKPNFYYTEKQRG